DDAMPKRDGEGLALRMHVLDALVRGVPAGQQLAVQEKSITGFPRGDLGRRQGVQIDAPRLRRWCPMHVGPLREIRRLELRRPRSLEHEMRVPSRRAIR